MPALSLNPRLFMDSKKRAILLWRIAQNSIAGTRVSGPPSTLEAAQPASATQILVTVPCHTFEHPDVRRITKNNVHARSSPCALSSFLPSPCRSRNGFVKANMRPRMLGTVRNPSGSLCCLQTGTSAQMVMMAHCADMVFGDSSLTTGKESRVRPAPAHRACFQYLGGRRREHSLF